VQKLRYQSNFLLVIFYWWQVFVMPSHQFLEQIRLNNLGISYFFCFEMGLQFRNSSGLRINIWKVPVDQVWIFCRTKILLLDYFLLQIYRLLWNFAQMLVRSELSISMIKKWSSTHLNELIFGQSLTINKIHYEYIPTLTRPCK